MIMAALQKHSETTGCCTWTLSLGGHCLFFSLCSFLNCSGVQLGERLVQSVPTSGVDVVELEDEGTCVRFSPLLTAAGNINT